LLLSSKIGLKDYIYIAATVGNIFTQVNRNWGTVHSVKAINSVFLLPNAYMNYICNT